MSIGFAQRRRPRKISRRPVENFARHQKKAEIAKQAALSWTEPAPRSAPRQRVPMRTFITTAALASAIALAATTATAPSLNSPVISETAQAALDGVILGSNVWPSVPVDARGRLQLVSSACEEERRCKSTSDGSIDD
jgi:hypothetical protein